MERKSREHISENLRDKVMKRDGYRCRYCGTDQGPFHLDHVYPYSKGGETTADNLVTSCRRCNGKKHNKVGMWPNPIGYYEMVNELGEQRERLTKPFPATWITLECLGILIASLHTYLPMVVNWPTWIWYITLPSGLAIFLYFFALQIGWNKK